MRFSRNKNKAKIGNVISFPLLQCWNPLTHFVTIAAQVNGQRVLCKISSKNLHAAFPKSTNDPMGIVKANRSRIEDAARKLILSNSFDKDGFIIIKTADL